MSVSSLPARLVVFVFIPHGVVLRNKSNFFLINGDKGILQVRQYDGSLVVQDEQIWRILKAHCSFLTVPSPQPYNP